MLTEEQRKRVFNIIILTQCLGMISGALFQNGFYLNYFSRLGISSANIAMLFALPPLLSIFLLLPFAFYSDRFGKKRLALAGQLLLITSLVITMSAGWWEQQWALPLLVASMVVFGVGGSLQGASWFALLNPIVPKEVRGRFFGRLRVIFQTVSIAFTLLITRVLQTSQTITAFQTLLGIVLVANLLRYWTYARIPELENARGEDGHPAAFRKAIAAVFAMPGYIRFNSYWFLVTLFTAATPTVFGLMQKDVFGFSPSQITLMGTLFLAGSAGGCWLGGRLVDRAGTRAVFLAAHMAFSLVMVSMLARHWVPWPLPVHAGACSFAFSLVSGMAGIAVTAETLALIPAANKSLSTAFTMTLFNGAVALSSMFVARLIGGSLLPSGWTMFGRTYAVYDMLLLGFSAVLLLMLAAIGFVPRVGRKMQLMPGGTCPRV